VATLIAALVMPGFLGRTPFTANGADTGGTLLGSEGVAY
jgi:hypothetical protein